jgi:hypothetical protein
MIGYFYDKEAQLETSSFLDDVLEYFQENNCERVEDFEEWLEEKEKKNEKQN